MTPKLVLMVLTMSATAAFAAAPYQGQQQRTIKALSAAETQGLLSGSGMGFAKAAELNHFPGPKHVLELADELNLSSEQVSETTIIFDQMKREAISLGEQLIEAEAELDNMFASNTITAEELDKQLFAIGRIRSKLRGVHLIAHLSQQTILSQHQLNEYDSLRGYSNGKMDHSQHDMAHH